MFCFSSLKGRIKNCKKKFHFPFSGEKSFADFVHKIALFNQNGENGQTNSSRSQESKFAFKLFFCFVK
jgi:hypothetical protein